MYYVCFQYESGILDICMMMLQVSNEHKKDWKIDYTKRFDPVYISRIASAMVSNCTPSSSASLSCLSQFFFCVLIEFF